MYPMKDPDESRAEVSQDNPRDIVEAIDALIIWRIRQNNEHRDGFAATEDVSELLKHKITDYLLVTDPRAGVFVKP